MPSDKDIVFITSDPLNNVITLSKDVWEKHIIVGHEDMKGRESEVQRCIEDPLIIAGDKEPKYPTNNYYRITEDTTIHNTDVRYTKVSVNISTSSIKSAFTNVKKIHPDDNPIIWIKPKIT